ncbi:MAG: FecR domain-containing protein [Verrucomicrobiota bacterium JB022]|nr:FecR domain-containing protein [Verrucomicrobiota bacterium JB022]
MRFNRSILPVFLFAWLVSGLFAAADQPAIARLLKVSGDYILLNPEGEERQLDGSRQLYEGEVLQTGEDSTGVILFSTGTVATLRPETTIEIVRNRQETVDEAASLKAAQETTPSDVQIKLYNGSVISDVKKLRGDSTYQIHTPLGTAGVRGTLFQTIYITPIINPVQLQPGNLVRNTSFTPSILANFDSNIARLLEARVNALQNRIGSLSIHVFTGGVTYNVGPYGTITQGGNNQTVNISGGQSGFFTPTQQGNNPGPLNVTLTYTPNSIGQEIQFQAQQSRNIVVETNPDTSFSDPLLPDDGGNEGGDDTEVQSPSSGTDDEFEDIDLPDLPGDLEDITQADIES